MVDVYEIGPELLKKAPIEGRLRGRISVIPTLMEQPTASESMHGQPLVLAREAPRRAILVGAGNDLHEMSSLDLALGQGPDIELRPPEELGGEAMERV